MARWCPNCGRERELHEKEKMVIDGRRTRVGVCAVVPVEDRKVPTVRADDPAYNVRRAAARELRAERFA